MTGMTRGMATGMRDMATDIYSLHPPEMTVLQFGMQYIAKVALAAYWNILSALYVIRGNLCWTHTAYFFWAKSVCNGYLVSYFKHQPLCFMHGLNVCDQFST